MPSATTFLSYLVVGFAAFASFVAANPTPSLTTKNLDLGLSRRDFYPEPRTNAERLRRGLGPLPPKRRYNGSRLQARQSTTPPPPNTDYNYIGVSAVGSSDIFGYLGQGGTGGITLVSSTSTALHVPIPSLSSGGPIEISVLDPITSNAFIGVASTSSSASAETLSASNRNVLQIVEVSSSPRGLPSGAGNSLGSGSSESTIWNLGANGVITPTWLNPDGSAPTLSVISVGSLFYVTGNPSGARLTLGGGIIVTLSLVAGS